MTDPLDLEAIKRLFAQRDPHNPYADEIDALIAEVERLRADVERKDEALREIVRGGRRWNGARFAPAHVSIARTALSENQEDR